MFKRIAKGFTLIELLIVIAIIGILAVAFLPSVLNAPAKGRDAARVAAIQKLQGALLNYNLEGNSYPTAGPDINPDDEFADGITWKDKFEKGLGGKFPVDPQTDELGDDVYYQYYAPAGDYSFAIKAKMETLSASNALCDSVANGVIEPPVDDNEATWCFAVLAE